MTTTSAIVDKHECKIMNIIKLSTQKYVQVTLKQMLLIYSFCSYIFLNFELIYNYKFLRANYFFRFAIIRINEIYPRLISCNIVSN